MRIYYSLLPYLRRMDMLSARARLVRISSLRILTWAGSQPRTKNWRRNGWKMRAAPFSWKQQERVSGLNSDNRKRKGDTHTHSNTVYKHTIERSCRLVGAIACKQTPVLTHTHTPELSWRRWSWERWPGPRSGSAAVGQEPWLPPGQHIFYTYL